MPMLTGYTHPPHGPSTRPLPNRRGLARSKPTTNAKLSRRQLGNSDSVIVTILAGLLPIELLGELVSIGTLLAFAIVCVGVLLLRVVQPDLPRPFKTPAVWFVAPAGAASSVFLMFGLPVETWGRLGLWLVVGLALYFLYGVHHSRLAVPTL